MDSEQSLCWARSQVAQSWARGGGANKWLGWGEWWGERVVSGEFLCSDAQGQSGG